MSSTTYNPNAAYHLYVYAWMPYPRRVLIYLREKGIPSSLVQIIPCSDPQLGSTVPDGFPPKPPGSLPLLVGQACPGASEPNHIQQSLAIMMALDELCDAGADGWPKSEYSLRGDYPLLRARNNEVLALADECLTAWNPVRLFGTGAGTQKIPSAAKESLAWVRRCLFTLEGFYKNRDVESLAPGKGGKVTMGDIVLYQFIEFARDCYGRDVLQGSGKVIKDVYGRDVKEEFPTLKAFERAFGQRESAKRAEGEWPTELAEKNMKTWHEGVWED